AANRESEAARHELEALDNPGSDPTTNRDALVESLTEKVVNADWKQHQARMRCSVCDIGFLIVDSPLPDYLSLSRDSDRGAPNSKFTLIGMPFDRENELMDSPEVLQPTQAF